METLKEILEIVGEQEEPILPPTPKKLRESFDPIRELPDGSAQVYPNGYAVYSNSTGSYAVWLPGISGYTYRSACRTAEKSISQEALEAMPWYIAEVPYGEDAASASVMNRKGDRAGSRTEARGERDKHEMEKAARWRNGGTAESPETWYLRNAQIRAMLEVLTPIQRMAIILYEVYGYTEAEIAGQKSISASAVAKTLRQARKKLGYRKIPF